MALPTSGTTGAAGEVVRTTASWWSSFAAYADLSGVRPGDRVWVPGPLASTMNLFAAVHARATGARLCDAPASRAVLTPALLERHLDELRPGTRVVVAGDALSPALSARAAAVGVETAHYYGAAELSFVACGRDAASLRAFPGAEVAVVDGVVWVRSAYVARSGPALRRRDDWASVGDLGTYDGTTLSVTGRPEAITTAGATVVLSEVEAALAGRATCFAVPWDGLGAILGAAVPPEDDAAVRASAGALPPAWRPRLWLCVDEPPLTVAGKIDRAALTRRWQAAHPGHGATGRV
ncbi:o-succinylbenzoate--CoA ligase [Marmoricola endophyticus]|uniref:o-succinylbenzoate--CoA ligase n=1 Tax=Marmoricola endophyticus TaxID=2040280 RepID=UPI00166D15DA|nr:o-succinylbenzoate--CoA ligase [Marmoricola endophyticus]